MKIEGQRNSEGRGKDGTKDINLGIEGGAPQISRKNKPIWKLKYIKNIYIYILKYIRTL